MSATLRFAETPADYAAFGEICRDYVDWCRQRYAALPSFVEEVFGHQALDDELKVLPSKYGPPNGRTLLAMLDSEVVGAGACRRLSETECELKRLYVRDAAKGQGLGRRLSQGLFAAARDDGYSVMKLDTAKLMVEAQTLYKALGFEPIAPYLTYPAHLLSHLVFMEKRL